MSNTLGEFEGADVVRSAIVITNAGDGLSEAVKVEPIVIHRGDTGYLVLEWECVQVGFSPADKHDPDGDAVRVQKLRAGTATFVDKSIVGHLIAEQHEKNLKAAEEAAGIQRLDLDGDEAGGDAPVHTSEDGDTRAVLEGLTKSDLRALCDVHDIVFGAKATGAQLVDLLVGVPGIRAEIQAKADGATPDNVTSIDRAADAGA